MLLFKKPCRDALAPYYLDRGSRPIIKGVHKPAEQRRCWFAVRTFRGRLNEALDMFTQTPCRFSFFRGFKRGVVLELDPTLIGVWLSKQGLERSGGHGILIHAKRHLKFPGHFFCKPPSPALN